MSCAAVEGNEFLSSEAPKVIDKVVAKDSIGRGSRDGGWDELGTRNELEVTFCLLVAGSGCSGSLSGDKDLRRVLDELPWLSSYQGY